MSFFVQHGYGKADRVHTLVASADPPAGLILSPKGERPNRLRETAQFGQENDLTVLLDPETYLLNLAQPVLHDNHDELGLLTSPLGVRAGRRAVRACAAAVCEVNKSLGLSTVVVPTPHQQVPDDRFATLAWQLLEETIELADGPVWASLCVTSAGTVTSGPVDDWLDEISSPTSGVDGLYLVVDQPSRDYPAPIDSDLWTRVGTMAADLSSQDLGFLVGFADIPGLVATSSGGSFASGWHHSLRSFHSPRFAPGTRGRGPNPRVYVRNLASPLLVEDAQQLLSINKAEEILGTDLAERLEHPVDRAAGQIQHLLELSSQASDLDGSTDPSHDTKSWIAQAQAYLAEIDDEGVVLEAVHAGRVESLRRLADNLI